MCQAWEERRWGVGDGSTLPFFFSSFLLLSFSLSVNLVPTAELLCLCVSLYWVYIFLKKNIGRSDAQRINLPMQYHDQNNDPVANSEK